MDLVISPEQEELRSSVRRFLEDKAPISKVRQLMEDVVGNDEAVWKQMAEQLGLQGLAIPEEYGGSGFSFVELCLVQEELGRALFTGPFFASAVLATQVLLNSGDTDACARYLPGIADGTTIATVAFTEEDGGWDVGAGSVQYADGVLNGVKSFVIDGVSASLILVLASTPEGPTLVAVDGDASGIDRRALPTLDQTRKLARLEFSGTPATLIGSAGQAAAGFTKALDRVAIALAAEQLGGADAALDMCTEYAKIRYQFGRPIGSFQAIKHKAADVLLKVESARSAVLYAMMSVADDTDEVPALASLIQAYVSDAYFFAAQQNIQIHGGIGFTWDYDAHLYFKRAKSMQLYLGDAQYHRAKLADRIGV